MGEVETLTFVKWAGGKTQLISQLENHFPKKFNNYFEPMVGGGAMLFYILQKYKPKKAYISDVNEELIITYRTIQKDVEKLIVKLRVHKKNHTGKGSVYFYQIRAQDPKKLSDVERAARFIYLNRTCFNGLYRVNSKGLFNVPVGKYANPDIVQEEKLRKISKLLSKVIIELGSFENVMKKAKKGDFVYFDPPYYPLKRESFTAYAEKFLDEEQKQLAKTFDTLAKRGVYVMESNSDTQFIKDLYAHQKIHIVRAKRLINSRADSRGEINETVIVNY